MVESFSTIVIYKKDLTWSQLAGAKWKAARENDYQQRKQRKQVTNNSVKCKCTNTLPGELLFILNNNQSTKYRPIYHQTQIFGRKNQQKGCCIEMNNQEETKQPAEGWLEHDAKSIMWEFLKSNATPTEKLCHQQSDSDNDVTITCEGDIENIEIEVNKQQQSQNTWSPMNCHEGRICCISHDKQYSKPDKNFYKKSQKNYYFTSFSHQIFILGNKMSIKKHSF